MSFADSPTITITPRQGEAMAGQLHEPLRVSAIVDLVSAGYPVEGAFRILVEGVNNLRGPNLGYVGFRPGTDEWREAVELLDKLENRGGLIVDRFRWNDPYNDIAYPAESITPEMWITTLSTGERRWKSLDGGKSYFFTTHEMAPAVSMDPDARDSEDGQRLMELLNVRPDVQKKIWVMQSARVAYGADNEGDPDVRRGTLKVRMRSLYNVLNYFAYGVRVPAEDEAEGRATDLSTFRAAVAQGEVQDLSEQFVVRYSKKSPDDAYQAVRYRDLWFYIDDADRETKAGFNALYDLWQLSIKEPSSRTDPVTTIQVN